MDHTENKLKEKGYMGISAYTAELLSVATAEKREQDDIRDCLQKVAEYHGASRAFHQPGGEGFLMVKQCLQRYQDLKFITNNGSFRFGETLFDGAISILGEENFDGRCGYMVSPKKEVMPESGGSRADIYYLLHEADQSEIAARRCMDYVQSNRLHLTAVLIQMIERITENMARDGSPRMSLYARILQMTYLEQESIGRGAEELLVPLGCSRKQYFRMKNEAITLLSETLFGFFAGESGMADLYIKDGRIVFGPLEDIEEK